MSKGDIACCLNVGNSGRLNFMADDDKKVVNGEEVVEGEIVEETKEPEISEDTDSVDEVTVGSDKAQTVMHLENLIKNNNAQIEKMSAELTEARQMLKDAFENDTTYREHADAAKDANKVKAATKAQILKQPAVAQIATNVKVLTSELKELKEALSQYLDEFNKLSGITEIEGVDGELMEIVYVAKLVKKRS